MKRSLVLAGGGMRVAWQAGVMKALEEDGLAFDHVDGSSGGILTAGMVLSGVGADEMCERWSTLDIRAFGSRLPLTHYLRGPWDLPALADRDGLVEKVYPALGIDVERIRSSAIEGTFNVTDFTHKTAIAVDASEIDTDLMAAGMSLPIFMTPLQRDGVVYTDAVWMRDANVGEALRRGADEVWLVWCIGNTAYWGDGPLEQYVHMIEMSAMGALLADFEAAAAAGREFTLHVIRPAHPLPLDPEFYLGRISSDSLVAMGYRDARAYLDSRRAEGLPKDETCTSMAARPPSVRFVETLTGTVASERFQLELTVVAPLDGSQGEAELAGFVDYPPWGGRHFLAGGRVEVMGRDVVYRGRVLVSGRWLELSAARSFHDGPGLDAWRDASTVALEVRPVNDDTDARPLVGMLRLGLRGAGRLLVSVEPVGAHGLAAKARALRRLAARGLAALYL